MSSSPTSIRLDAETLEMLSALGDRSSVIRKAVALLYRIESTGDFWVGDGIWKGWRLTTAHSASSYGQPVIVMPDGTALGPGDITACLAQPHRQRQTQRD